MQNSFSKLHRLLSPITTSMDRAFISIDAIEGLCLYFIFKIVKQRMMVSLILIVCLHKDQISHPDSRYFLSSHVKFDVAVDEVWFVTRITLLLRLGSFGNRLGFSKPHGWIIWALSWNP